MTTQLQTVLEALELLAQALPENRSTVKTCYAINDHHRDAVHKSLQIVRGQLESLREQVRKEQMYVQELAADAEQWRAYKARKDAVIAAGMGRNPLRQEVKPDTYAVINADGEVEYSAPWEEACHDHIKDMQDVHPTGTVSKWKVRGIKILPVMKGHK